MEITAKQFNEYMEKVFATCKDRDAAMKADEPVEVEVEPGIYHAIGKSGKIYAIYGDNFRNALKKLNEFPNTKDT